jgi:hypothetical protein
MSAPTMLPRAVLLSVALVAAGISAAAAGEGSADIGLPPPYGF